MKSLLLVALIAYPLQAQPCERICDSLREELKIAQAEMRRADQASLVWATLASLPQYTVSVSNVRKADALLAPALTIGFEGRAHQTAIPYGGIGVVYKNGNILLMADARMEWFLGSDADSAHGIVLPQKAEWRSSFEGGIKYLLQ